MDKDSIQKLILNRGNSKYSEEINIWIKLINHILKDISVIHWTPFDNNILYSLKNPILLIGWCC